MLSRLIIILMALFLVACGGRQPTSYHLIAPSTVSGKRCLKNCHTIRMMCYKMCHKTDRRCLSREKMRAKARFADYQAQPQAQTTKKWQDFYQPQHCKDVACGCKKDYNDCYQMCGGQLVPVYN